MNNKKKIMKCFLQVSFSIIITSLFIFFTCIDSYSQTNPETDYNTRHQKFLDNYKGTAEQKKIAYVAAKELISILEDTDCIDLCDYFQFWIDKYEISQKTRFDITDWGRVKTCGFTLFAPKTLKDLDVHGIDSCVRELEDESIKVAVDVGYFTGKFEKSDKFLEYKEDVVEIAGQKAQAITFIDTNDYVKKRGDRKYIAGLHIEINEAETRMHYFNITISGKTEKDLETAKQIFKTIKFR